MCSPTVRLSSGKSFSRFLTCSPTLESFDSRNLWPPSLLSSARTEETFFPTTRPSSSWLPSFYTRQHESLLKRWGTTPKATVVSSTQWNHHFEINRCPRLTSHESLGPSLLPLSLPPILVSPSTVLTWKTDVLTTAVTVTTRTVSPVLCSGLDILNTVNPVICVVFTKVLTGPKTTLDVPKYFPLIKSFNVSLLNPLTKINLILIVRSSEVYDIKFCFKSRERDSVCTCVCMYVNRCRILCFVRENQEGGNMFRYSEV